MEHKLILNAAIAEITPEDFTHPGLRMVRFIFCDDQPNENNQGIAEEDFDEIIKSGVGTPLKMKFFGQSAGGHQGSIPIGYIRDMFKREETGVKQLVAEAVLFADEYPDEVEYLAHSFAEGTAPGISWELRYNNSVIKDGIEWLKGLVTRAATFVRSPAYGARTAILALASDTSVRDEDLKDAFTELFGTDSPKNDNKGGNNRMEEELQTLRDKVAELEKKLEEQATATSEKDSTIEALTTERDELKTSVSEYQTRELIASRTAALVEAGISLPTEPEKLAAKQVHWASLSEEAFTSTIEDLKEAISSAKKVETTKEGLAERLREKRPASLPKFSAAASDDEGEDEQPTFDGLRAKFKNISRSNARADSE